MYVSYALFCKIFNEKINVQPILEKLQIGTGKSLKYGSN